MQAVILAAGMGRRLGDLTTAVPKALIEVGGKPLIDYALAFAKAAGATRRIVVGGFCHADVAARVRKVDAEALIAENTDYKKGNLLTLQAGRARLEPGSFLLMNTDHVYRPAIAKIVADTAAGAVEVTGFCDRDRTLGADDMKVRLDAKGRVEAMAKALEKWDVGYVGMTWVPGSRAAAHREASETILRRDGESVNVEAVLVELARVGTPPAIADISGHGWLEIDEPHERERATKVLESERWWD